MAPVDELRSNRWATSRWRESKLYGVVPPAPLQFALYELPTMPCAGTVQDKLSVAGDDTNVVRPGWLFAQANRCR